MFNIVSLLIQLIVVDNDYASSVVNEAFIGGIFLTKRIRNKFRKTGEKLN